MRVQRLQHVSSPYPAGRQDEVRAFYGRLLGMDEITPPRTLAGRGLIWFSSGPDSLELHFFPGVVDPDHPRHICLEVLLLDTARRQLEEAGHKPYDTTPIPNRPRFFCRDSLGNLVEFTTILGDFRESA
ncbi:MAG: VOC family protein [bacterium]